MIVGQLGRGEMIFASLEHPRLIENTTQPTMMQCSITLSNISLPNITADNMSISTTALAPEAPERFSNFNSTYQSENSQLHYSPKAPRVPLNP